MAEPQLVLSTFGVDELRQLYEVERSAYEIWRCGAVRRALGKGASLIVTESGKRFRDERDEELARLLSHFDHAETRLEATSTGAVIQGSKRQYLCPTYNTDQEDARKHIDMLGAFGIRIEVPDGCSSNFSLRRLNLAGIYEALRPYGHDFRLKQGVELAHVIGVVAGLLRSTELLWRESGGTELVRYLQRAYHGPATTEVLADFVLAGLPAAIADAGINADVGRQDVVDVLAWMTLSDGQKAQIEPMAWGPSHLLLPGPDGRVFVDFAWLHLFLYWLDWKLEPDDDAIKGQLLEIYAGNQVDHGELRNTPLRSYDGTSRQVDVSAAVDDTLVIVECKALGRSVASELGHESAYRHRRRALEAALVQIDDKAAWLQANPRSSTHDLWAFARIVPIVCTPFNEFIPSLSDTWWLCEGTARVMTPSQLGEFVSDESIVRACCWNVKLLRP